MSTHSHTPDGALLAVPREWCTLRRSLPRCSIVELFVEAVRQTPEADALLESAGDDAEVRTLSYGELDARANAVAQVLVARGVQPGDRVAILLPRSIETVVCMLGTLKAGAAYVPIDPRYPADRVRFLLEDCDARVALVSEQAGDVGGASTRQTVPIARGFGAENFAAENFAAPPDVVVPDTAIAYVLYTSGSTGRPKGVEVTHRGVARLAADRGLCRHGPGRTMLHLASPAFDATTYEVWVPLLNGGRVVVHAGGVLPDGPALSRVIRRHGVTTALLITSLFNTLVDDGPTCLAGLEDVLVGGEALSVSHLRRAQRELPGTRFYNVYGPTETTVLATGCLIAQLDAAATSVPIGGPVLNTDVYVLDDEMRSLPIGVEGELWVGGDGVAAGYLNRPALTRERFVDSPFEEGARLYRTGDRVRWMPTGQLEFLGRADGQVKLRGHRIELGEIEVALRAHPAVADAVAMVRGDVGNEPTLVAYVTITGDAVASADLRRHASARLAPYMVPSVFVTLPAIPLTPHGKADRRALPPPVRRGARSGPLPEGALGPLTEAWSRVTGRDDIGPDDRFVDAGATSLTLMRLATHLRSVMGLQVSLVDLYEHPTLRSLSRHLDEPRTEAGVTESSAYERRGGAIAIIGMALRFPGASTADEFWRVLDEARVTTRRLDPDALDPSLPESTTRRPDYVPVRGNVDASESFDRRFFAMSAREATLTDPQHRVFLEVAHESLEDAGIDPARFQGRVGVYAGSGETTYLTEALLPARAFTPEEALTVRLGNEKDHVVTRVAYKLGLRGPAVSVNTACSTSLVAVIQAVAALRAGHCDAAIAGGVAIRVPLRAGYLHVEGGMVSGTGVCRPFDAEADGTVFNDGVGVVVLRRLEDAVADGDRVDAVIVGVGTNNDGGDKVSFSAPSVRGQADAIRAAQRDAGVTPDDVQYVEAHATATPVGDPIELAALRRAFGGSARRHGPCWLGSVKGNVGHLVEASGVAGLIKTTLSLRHGRIPATAGFRTPNPELGLLGSPFSIAAGSVPWPPGDVPRRAGVSSFGVGGTNAHVVIQEAPRMPNRVPTGFAHPMPLSARTPTALSARAAQLSESLRTSPDVPLEDVSRTLAAGRSAMRYRTSVVARTREEAVALLGGARSFVEASQTAPGVAFLLPGQGSQHAGMARGLYGRDPAFTETVDRCADAARGCLPVDLLDLLLGSEDDAAVDDALQRTENAQAAIFAVEAGLLAAWQRLGIRPRAMVGHSVGEFAAAVHAEIMSLEEALGLVVERGKLLQALPAGAMLSVRLDARKVESLMGAELSLAADNSPSLSVVSGPEPAIASFESDLAARGVPTKRLVVSHAFHSSMMEPAVAPFAARVRTARLASPKIPIVSTVTGQWLTDEQATDAGYWAGHLRTTVRFRQALEVLGTGGIGALVEVGPRQTGITLARQCWGRQPDVVTVSSLGNGKPGEAAWEAWVGAALRLWERGIGLDPSALTAPSARKVALPPYPFERERLFIDPPAAAPTQVRERPVSELRLAGGPPGRVAASSASGPSSILAAQSKPARAASEGPPMSRKQALIQKLARLLEEVSGEDLDAGAHATPFIELGFDSLMLTQAGLSLTSQFGVSVKLRQLLEDLSTLEALADHLDTVMPPEVYVDGGEVASEGFAAEAEGAGPESSEALYDAFTRPSGPRSPLEHVVRQQLELMTRQLDVLSGATRPTEGSATEPSRPAASPRQTPTSAPTAQPSAADETLDDAAPGRGHGPALVIDRRKSGDLTSEQRRHLGALVARYTERTVGSKRFTQDNRHRLADPRTASGFKPLIKELVYPLVVDRSQGSRLWDVDGNEYIDYLNGFGSNLFGHSPSFVRLALEAQLTRGVEIGPQHPMAAEVAELVAELTGAERVAFCNTGSEAVLGAMRIARTVTGRDTIVMFSGGYHGIVDEVIVRGTRKLTSLPAAPGIPRDAVRNVLVLDLGTDEALEILRARADEIAAVITEPVQSRRPELVPVEFLREVRAITERSGTALVFDEIVTGFRCAPGGAQERFGIRADLATYGKVVGGGLPIGILTGRRRWMDALDGGGWSFGDDSIPEIGVTYFAGTFVRHPLALAAAKAALLHLRERGPALQVEVDEKAERFARDLGDWLAARNAPLAVHRFSSLLKVAYTEEVPYGELLSVHLRDQGVHAWDGRPGFLTEAHSSDDVGRLIEAFQASVVALEQGGFLPERGQSRRSEAPPVAGARLGRDPNGNAAWFVEDPDRRGKYLCVGAA